MKENSSVAECGDWARMASNWSEYFMGGSILTVMDCLFLSFGYKTKTV